MSSHKKKAMGRIPHSLSWLENSPEQEQHTEEEPQYHHSTHGLEPGWTRATFIVDAALHEKVKAYAYWKRVTVKEVVDAALTQFFADKEVEPIPENTKQSRNRLLE